MKIKYLYSMVFLLAVFAAPLAAQTAAGDAVFAPFVSRLQGEIKNNLIRLSWVDSPHIQGPVSIYRSLTPFDEASQFPGSGIKVMEIPYGIQSYVDEIESGDIIYYFVAASDGRGRSYDIPINFTNTISMRPSSSGSYFPSNGSSVSPPERTGPRSSILSLEAAPQGDRVVITFSDPGATSPTLYRSIRPMKNAQDLLGAVIVRTNISSPFTDFPVPGIPYYYALVPEEELVRGTAEVVPGRNATLLAVQLSAGASPQERNIREIPLPQISVQGAVPSVHSYSTAPSASELSPEAARALRGISSPSQNVLILKTPRVFARDIEVSRSAGAEDYALSSIVKGPFTSQNWERARDDLVRFLAQSLEADTKTRARFYLGQCYYYLGQGRQGFFEFLSIQGRYPAESQEWIQASLSLIKN